MEQRTDGVNKIEVIFATQGLEIECINTKHNALESFAH